LSRTRVDLASNLAGTPLLPAVNPPTQPVADNLPDLQGPQLPLNDANVKTYVLQRRWRESDMAAFLKAQGWSARKVAKTVNSPRITRAAAPPMEGVFAFRARLGFFGHNAPTYNSLPVQGTVLRGDAFPNSWDGASGWEIWKDPNKPPDLIFHIVGTGFVRGPFAANSLEAAPEAAIEAEAPLEARAQAFTTEITGVLPYQPAQFRRHNPYWDDAHVYLERAVQGLVGNSWAVFELPTAQYTVYQVSEVNETSLAAFSVSGKASGLLLKNADGTALTRTNTLTVRKTGAHVQSERMTLVDVPIQEAIAAGANGLALDRLVLGLQVGQELILSGERADLPGVAVSETVILSGIIHDKGYTTLYFLSPLQNSYTRSTVLLTANLARATHGETTREALGNGDGSQPNQRFVLKKPPLTYVSAPTPSGGKSTLEVRVDGVLWQQVSSLYGLGPRSQNYIVRIGDDGKATVIFGDGQRGARLPTGQENVIATYRTGTGPDGEVSAGSLTLLQTRPLGIRGVTNPLPASGAEVPEKLATARTNAPLTVLTLDRIVSLQDFEDFARAFAGIGKAQAAILWNGQRAVVQITVATASGATVDPTSDLSKNLRKAIDDARDQLQQVDIAGFRPRTFSLDAGVLVDSRYVAADVIAQVAAALLATFSFEARNFSQPVTSSEVIAAIQTVPGVIAVDLNTLTPDNGTRPADRPPTLLSADTAHVGQGAELLTINPSGIKLKEMTI
ncbi:MAG TPA: putative baseplate assembly protein, partial [Chloroflexia bacterium]|nr:putative baseplate assembly protein [Chloroflexia bacterium]